MFGSRCRALTSTHRHTDTNTATHQKSWWLPAIRFLGFLAFQLVCGSFPVQPTKRKDKNNCSRGSENGPRKTQHTTSFPRCTSSTRVAEGAGRPAELTHAARPMSDRFFAGNLQICFGKSPPLDCYWVGSLGFIFLGNQGAFHQTPNKLNFCRGVNSNQAPKIGEIATGRTHLEPLWNFLCCRP